jgi:uncharacterized membrane protein YfcA
MPAWSGDRGMAVIFGWHSWWHAALAFVAAFAAGAVNAVAGGGTILTFVTLLWLGIPAVKADATSAVGLWPGGFGGAWGFRHEITKAKRWWFWLAVPSVAGGALGAYLLVNLPPRTFAAIAPYLVLGATVLLALEEPIKKALHGVQGKAGSLRQKAAALGVEFVISIYGGYFGAGLGFLVLTALQLFGVKDLDQANGLKNVLALAIKGVAVIYFIVIATVVWHAVVVMIVGAIAGAYAGALIEHQVEQRTMHWVIVGIGMAMTALLFVRRYH